MLGRRRFCFVVLCALACCLAGMANAQIAETNGVVRLEAESSTNRISRTIGGVGYSWNNDTATPGFSGTGYIEAFPANTNSTATVTNAWETTSPQADYRITFNNPGTYYVWVRGYAGDASSAGVYVGVNSNSPTSARVDLQQFNAWSWANTAAGSSTPVSINIPSSGTYTLNLWMRDAWLDVDRIVLTRNPNFSPAPDANFWRNQNIYQIITDRFYNGETTNDSAVPNFGAANGGQAHGGDFKGIEKKLDYIKALGATAIWISPVVKNANGDYHGYAATDFYAVNPRMGTLAELQSLIREAHKRGILVINDVVVNHGSTWVDSGDAGWGGTFRFPPSGYTLRYNSGGQQYAAPFANTNLTATFGNTDLANIFHNNCGSIPNYGDATQVELGELVSLDDFKTESTYIRDRMKEIWTYWINAAGFDAYRLDTVKHVEMGFWDAWSPAIRASAQAADNPNFIQFGEIFDGSDSKCGSYTGTKSGGNYKMESVIDYPLYYQMGSVFGSASSSTGQIEARYNNLTTNNYDATALNSLILNLDNHDNPRFLATTGSSTARLEVALVFMYTSRGIPSLYYGTEQDFNGGADPNNREDMFDGAFEQGPSLGDNFNMTGARFKLVAKLNNLRRLYPALRTGSHDNLWANFSGPGLLAYARRLNGEEAYVVINTATNSQTIGTRPTIHPAGTMLVDVMNSSNTLTVSTNTDGIPSFTMPAASYRVYVAQTQLRALAPVVGSISPAYDATGVNTASTITVTFSQGMNTNSAQTAFSTDPASTGGFVWASNNTVMTYTPSSNLAGTNLYTVRIGTNATDSNGLAMYAPFESRFTTAAPSTNAAAPSINSVSSSGVTDTGASLAAAVTANGAATTVFYQYGTATNYGTTTASQAIGSGNSPVNVATNLSALTPGTLYNYRVYATNSAGTTYGTNKTFTTASPLPQVTTTAASFVGTGSANINGEVNPNGLNTSVYFEWSDRSDVITNATALQSAGAGTTLTNQWAALSGLSPDTTYFFRMVGVNATNSTTNKVYGATISFKTLPVKPIVNTLPAANISVTNAVLAGTVNPNGSGTVFFFEYGTNESYGTATAAQAVGSGTNTLTNTVTLADLIAGQVYYYRAAASNAFGISYGSAQSFSAGLPPPAATTLAPAGLNTTAATLRGSVNPNDSQASAWFEWGTSTNYGSTSRTIAADNAEGYTAFNLSGGSVGGGTGFGNFTRFSIGTGAGTFLANNSSNQTIDGSKSWGAYAGTDTGVSFRRAISTTRQYGTVTVSARFNVDNTKGFTGFNIKSTQGSGSGGFGSGELVSFGIAPAAGSNGILVTDAAGQRVLDLGAPIINTIIDFEVDFDALNRRYVVGAKFRTNPVFTKTISGEMSGTGTNVTHLGFANWNSAGAFQDLMFDSLQVLGSSPVGGGTNAVSVSNALSGLSANTLYHYRVAAMNLDGGINYGANTTFYTGIDLAVAATNTNSVLVQGGTGQFTVTVSNLGGSNSTSAAVTVSNQFPAGMTMTSMSGSGWSFNSNNLTATRSGTLNTGTNYPPITIAFAVASNAQSLLTNTVTVSGGGDGNVLNNTNTMLSSVLRGPDLTVAKSTNGTYQQGGTGTFNVTVSNIGGSPSSSTVTVTELPSAGMTVSSMSGDGWTFNSNNLTCTRADVLSAGTNYPPITVGVSIATNAPAAATNSVTLSGGGDINSTNNTAQSVASINIALAPDSGAASDSNVATGDGLPNLLKYALGLNPTNAATAAEKPSLQNFPPLAIKFRRAKEASDVTIKVEAADSTTTTWTNIWTSATNVYGGGTNPSEVVIVQDPVPETNSLQRYLRLKVTRP
ncbi:MAG: hypothetical protein RIQ71_1878 [Verrucomicrobiota bacterium]|jgi:uncharacterized repeat protein (TIGR01451 family)